MSGTRSGAVAPVPCAAHPYTSLVHVDGPCRCFAGGPPPEYAQRRPAAPVLGLVPGGRSAAPRWVAGESVPAEQAC